MNAVTYTNSIGTYTVQGRRLGVSPNFEAKAYATKDKKRTRELQKRAYLVKNLA